MKRDDDKISFMNEQNEKGAEQNDHQSDVGMLSFNDTDTKTENIGEHLSTEKEYLNGFKLKAVGGKEQAHNFPLTLHYAYENRRFETDQFWKRTTYFWTLIVLCFAAFGLLLQYQGQGKHPQIIGSFGFYWEHILPLLCALMGFSVSVGWHISNRGSQHLMKKWKKHVEMLEDYVIGPLHKTTHALGGEPLIVGAYPYSVSRVNTIISFCITVIWGILYVGEVVKFSMLIPERSFIFLFTAVSGILFLLLFFMMSEVSESRFKKATRVDFYKIKIKDK